MEESKNFKVGFQGFICPRAGFAFEDGTSPIDRCLMDCTEPCMSLPILLAIAKTRGIREGYYSVTENLNPPQVTFLKRNKPYFEHPKKMIWATLGTAWHNVLEDGMAQLNEEERKHYHLEEENKFEVDFGFAKLTGRPDLWHDLNLELTDFKTMKVYTAKKLKAGDWDDSTYHWQINMYKVYKYPEAKKLTLEAVIKDHQQRNLLEGIEEYERIDVPILNRALVEERVYQMLKAHVAAQDGTAPARRCKYEEIWMQENPRSKNHGIPLRCKDYCVVSTVCPQAKEWYNKNGGWRDANTISTTRPQVICQTMSETQ